MVKETLAHYGVREDVNLICVTYPLYQMRVATEFSFGLQDVANAWVRIADIEPKMFSSAAYGAMVSQGVIAEERIGRRVNENLRIFSYDRLDMQLADLTLANGVAHLFREHGKPVSRCRIWEVILLNTRRWRLCSWPIPIRT